MPPRLVSLGRFVGQVLLFIAGVGVVALAVMIWLNPETASVATVSEKSTVTVVAPPPSVSGSPNPAATAQTTTTTTDRTTQTTTPPASKRSDTLITALLAIGAAGVLVGVFLNRITGIKVAGTELALSARVAEKMAEKTTPKSGADRVKLRVAYTRALREAEKLGTSPGDDAVIDHLADEALQTTFAGNVPPP